jgi:hypothetical protein
VALAVAGGLVACSPSTSKGATTSPPPVTASSSETPSQTPDGSSVPTSADEVANGPQPPKDGAWVGAWVKPDEMSQSGRIAAVTTFQKALGRTLDIVHVYHDWDERFPTESDREFAKQGSVILLSWAGTDTRAIQSGQYDDLIRTNAETLKAWGVPILLEWRWEMDRPNLRSQVWTAGDYIAAWKHIRSIFADVGVPNVGWVWCPLAIGFDTNRAQPFYPGDDQVDWICADVYPTWRQRSFKEASASFLAWAKDHPKPIIIGELGVQAAHGEQTRQDWLSAMASFVKTQPQIKALVYFNADNSNNDKPYDMSLLNAPGSLEVFKQMAHDPHFDVGVGSAG